MGEKTLRTVCACLCITKSRTRHLFDILIIETGSEITMDLILQNLPLSIKDLHRIKCAYVIKGRYL